MNNLAKVFLGLALMVMTAQAQAGACHILIGPNQPCAHMLPPILFQDSDALANMSPKRCIERAYEYHRYCGFEPAKNHVVSYYHNGKTWVNASVNSGAFGVNNTYVANDFGHWIFIGTTK